VNGNGGSTNGDNRDSSNQYTMKGLNISGPFGKQVWAATIAQITDGTTNTIAMGEALPYCSTHSQNGWANANALWYGTSGGINAHTCPNDPDYNSDASLCHSPSSWGTAMAFKSRHTGGCHLLLCDGSVRFATQNIDVATYQKLGDRRDKQPIGDW